MFQMEAIEGWAGAGRDIAGREPLHRPASREASSDGPVVHVIDFDAEARAHLSEVLACTALRLRFHRDLDAFLHADLREEPGCVILDAVLAPVAEDLRSGASAYPMVMTARRADVATAVQAMKAGAVDFVERPFRASALLPAIGAALDLDRQRRVAASQSAALRARYQALTPRERQVMALVTAGKMNKQVAGDLGLSEITVKAHRGAMMRKIGARTLAELVRMADALGGEA